MASVSVFGGTNPLMIPHECWRKSDGVVLRKSVEKFLSNRLYEINTRPPQEKWYRHAIGKVRRILLAVICNEKYAVGKVDMNTNREIFKIISKLFDIPDLRPGNLDFTFSKEGLSIYHLEHDSDGHTFIRKRDCMGSMNDMSCRYCHDDGEFNEHCYRQLYFYSITVSKI